MFAWLVVCGNNIAQAVQAFAELLRILTGKETIEMRRIHNMFEPDGYRGTGRPEFTGMQILTIVLSVLSLLGAIYIIANFNALLARIAICVANLLTMGFPLLVLLVVIAVWVGRTRWRRRRWF